MLVFLGEVERAGWGTPHATILEAKHWTVQATRRYAVCTLGTGAGVRPGRYCFLAITPSGFTEPRCTPPLSPASHTAPGVAQELVLWEPQDG